MLQRGKIEFHRHRQIQDVLGLAPKSIEIYPEDRLVESLSFLLIAWQQPHESGRRWQSGNPILLSSNAGVGGTRGTNLRQSCQTATEVRDK